MSTFYRRTAPAYFGGLPAGYAYINNLLSGTPAFADGAKGSGPNAGTFYVAFGEDATSSDANRPADALATNTDALDDLLHRDIALVVRTTDTGPTGSPTPTVTLTGPGIFLGNAGAQLKDLFHVTDANDDDIDVAGTKVLVQSFTGGTIGTGFSSGNITLTFNVSIPTGTTYHIYYGTRTNWATFPSDGLTMTRIRGAVDVDAQVEELFRLLHGNGEAWNAAWDSTVWDLTAGGLDARYRRSTTGVAGAFNVAGSGGQITRDGPAPSVLSQVSSRLQPDEFLGGWAAHLRDIGAQRSSGALGSWGFVADTHRWQTAGELASAPSLGGFLSIWRRDAAPISSSPASGLGYWTYIPAGVTGTVTALANGLYRIVLDATNSPYFWKTDTGTAGNPIRSAMALNQDMLSITAGGQAVAVVLLSFDTTDVNARTALVTAVDGGNIPGYNPGPTTVSAVQWVSPLFYASNGAATSKNSLDVPSSGENLPAEGVYCVTPPLVVDVHTTDAAFKQYTPASASYFGAGTTDDAAYTPVLSWGAYNSRVASAYGAQWVRAGSLNSDGSVQATHYEHTALIMNLSGSNQTLNLDISKNDTFYIRVTGGSTISQINLNNPGSTTFTHIRLIFDEFSAAQLVSAEAWPAVMTFSSTSTPWLKNVAGAVDVFDIEVIDGVKFFTTNVENRGLNGHIQIQNWLPQLTLTGTIGPYALTWNDSSAGPSAQTWLMGSFVTGMSATAQVLSGTGDGTWTPVGAPVGLGSPPSCICVDSAGNIYVSSVFSTTYAAAKCTPGGTFAAYSSAAVGGLSDFQLAAVGTTILGGVGSSTSAFALLGVLSGGSFVAHLSGLTAQLWVIRSNGSLVVAAAQPANQNLYTSSDGVTWTTTALVGLIGAGSTIADVAWSTEKSLWLMVVTVASGHNTFYTSVDGVTWVATGASLATTSIVALAAIGKAWVALSVNNSNGVSTLAYSYDAATWYSALTQLHGNTTDIPKLAASPMQVGALSALPVATTAGDSVYRFSLAWGKPNAVLT